MKITLTRNRKTITRSEKTIEAAFRSGKLRIEPQDLKDQFERLLRNGLLVYAGTARKIMKDSAKLEEMAEGAQRRLGQGEEPGWRQAMNKEIDRAISEALGKAGSPLHGSAKKTA